MCTGGRLIADFVAGTYARPSLPEVCEEHLTATADGLWVVWGYKLAYQVGNRFMPLTGGSGYPADARAVCRFRRAHSAPDPKCTCGFHALSRRSLPGLPVANAHVSALSVALSGRVLAFQWAGGGVLWRAERQTVVRIDQTAQSKWPEFDHEHGVRVADIRRRHPEDPEGRLAVLRPEDPRDPAPIRLKLPVSVPVVRLSDDDAGWCIGTTTPREHAPGMSGRVLARAAV